MRALDIVSSEVCESYGHWQCGMYTIHRHELSFFEHRLDLATANLAHGYKVCVVWPSIFTHSWVQVG